MIGGRRARLLWGAVVLGGLPGAVHARRGKTPPPPDAWSYTVTGTRTVQSTATGAAAGGIPEALTRLAEARLAWTARAGLTTVHSDGSVTELVRVEAPGTAMHGRAFGLRRFDDGEVLRVERLLEVADTELMDWDPVLGALSPARPDAVTIRKPASRALQWTARLGTAQFLRTNCPSNWTLLEEADSEVEGWLGRPVETVQYEGRCSLQGRADGAEGQPTPLRGTGTISGQVWWDAGTHQVIRHDLTIDRTVRSRWLSPTGRVELIQEQHYAIRVDWVPATAAPEALRLLPTEAFTARLPEVLASWSHCAETPSAKEVVLVLGTEGAIDVRTIREPPGATAPASTFPVDPERSAPLPQKVESTAFDTACWQAAADTLNLAAHDDIGVRFTFVLPWRDDGFGMPGLVERARPRLGALFVVAGEEEREATEAWLGVR
ncbi:MAG TPA: hypothetical protein DFR83_23455 [Deltaproteobacteria bacterium]|nr:hypothetical protein [Deltaproteobacteria bacterium]